MNEFNGAIQIINSQLYEIDNIQAHLLFSLGKIKPLKIYQHESSLIIEIMLDKIQRNIDSALRHLQTMKTRST